LHPILEKLVGPE